MSFAGRRVLALESRRAVETAELIRRNGGEPFVAPSMREVPLEANEAVFAFAERLFAGQLDTVVFLTGVGTRYLVKALATRYPADKFTEALRNVTVIARGPKPTAALREIGVVPNAIAGEPNTWREVLDVLSPFEVRRAAVQLYGKAPEELERGLRDRGAEVMLVPVYVWEMPEDKGPLMDAARGLVTANFDVVLFTTGHQIVNLMEAARELGIEAAAHAGLKKMMIASIGPSCSETLRELGFEPTMEPSHPKLGVLVREAALFFGGGADGAA